MAKISANGGQVHLSVTFSKAEDAPQLTADGKTHLTLTVTSDRRLLRKISHRFRSSQRKCGYRLSTTGYTLVTRVKVHPDRMENKIMLAQSLADIAARWGYTPDSEA
jgi:hypothetical protein